jgi:hypothetical protein
MGGGKTYMTKKTCLSNKLSNYVYDVNGEYSNFPKSKLETDFETFFNECEIKERTNLIFEDATGEISGKVEKQLKRMVIAKRHTKNNFFFLFHSIEDVPPFLFRMVEIIILFKTGDLEENVKRKAPILLKPFKELQASNYLYNSVDKKHYSPMKIIKKM